MLTKLETLSSPSSLSFPVPAPKLNQRTLHGIQTTKGAPYLFLLSASSIQSKLLIALSANKEEAREEEVDVSKLCLNSNYLDFVGGKKLLSELSTLGIGGPCNYFVQVFNTSQLVSAIRYYCEHSIRFIIVGKGSNCLFDDLGFDGCVILNRIVYLEKIKPGIYRAGSGYPFNRLGIQCCSEGFEGLEFAGGIPGTVGGATYMNAGANGQETADTIYTVQIVTIDGRHQTLHRNDLSFGYRRSSFQKMENMAAIVAVTFQLKPSGLQGNGNKHTCKGEALNFNVAFSVIFPLLSGIDWFVCIMQAEIISAIGGNECWVSVPKSCRFGDFSRRTDRESWAERLQFRKCKGFRYPCKFHHQFWGCNLPRDS